MTTPADHAVGTSTDLVIRPLTVAPEEIAHFISEVYDTHPHGKSLVPRWNGKFFKHIIFDHPDFTPDHALGAYIDDRLAGLIMAQPYSVHLGPEVLKAIYGSWLAVTPEGAQRMAAVRLIDELRVRHKARGAKFMVGVAYRSGARVGLDFWESLARAFPDDISEMRDLPFWVRVIDGAALARAVKDPLLKIGAHAARLRPVREPTRVGSIRPFQAGDEARCRQLFANAGARLRTAPTAWELRGAPDLDTGPQTLVACSKSGVQALAMFHTLPMSDAAPLAVGMIDHLIDSEDGSHRADLLAATLWRLKQGGACIALMPRKPHIPTMPMLLAGFVPFSAEFRIFLVKLCDEQVLEMPASYDLMVR